MIFPDEFRMIRAAVLLSFIAAALGEQWAIDLSTTITYITGVGASSANLVAAAGGQNGVGSVVEYYDGTQWSKNKVPSLMVMATAVSGAGTIIAPGMGSILVSGDGKTYVEAPNLKGVAQTADAYGSNKENFAVAGSWETTDATTGKPRSASGVAYSTDNGASFSVSGNVPDGYVRYGAYPSDQVWYVASGIWGEDPAAAGRSLSARMKLDTVGKQAVLDLEPRKQFRHADTNATGWFGSVSKTTDGGATWTQVLQTNLAEDYLYFNEISCGSELNCVVVGEGDGSTGGYLTVAYATFDGGKSWERTLSSSDFVSSMVAKFTGPNTVWIVPTKKSGRTLSAQFMKSIDGGKTFSLVQALDNC
ncbi:MAG: hypothetical protein EOP84_24945, partial [Verrucomicrobiaceae bacterium]